jgi:tetratricopeptide (TPR) repeat protein
MPANQAASFLREIIGEGSGTDAEIDRLVRRCGRLPLALRVAGRYLRGHPGLAIDDYIAAVDQAAVEFAIPGEPDSDVRAVLGLSAKALAREEPVLAERWQLLAVFPDEFDRDGAAAVWELEATKASLQLSDLAARSMVMHDEASRRWRLHDLMRDVVGMALEGQGQAALGARLEAARARHARHYCGVLWRCDALYKEKGRLLEGLALYDLEQRSIAAGQTWAAARIEQDDAAARLAADYANAGAYVLTLRLHPRVWIDWLEAQRRGCARLNDRQGEANALGNLGNAWYSLGEPRRAIEFHEQVLAIAREMGDRRSEGSALGNLGVAWAALGEPQRAIEFYEQVLTIARAIGDRRSEGNALGSLGNAWVNLGEPRRATEFYEQVLAIAREIGDRRGEGNTLGNLGLAWADLGEPRRAIEFYEQRLEIAGEIGDRRGEGNALGNLGLAWADLGEPRRGIEFHEQHLAIAREIGDRRGEGNALFNSALALDALGERVEAVRRARAALAIDEAMGVKHRVDEVRAQLAQWGAADGGS